MIIAKSPRSERWWRNIGKSKGGGRSPNDMRSDALNPNNEEYQDAQDNRSVQLNPESDEEKE